MALKLRNYERRGETSEHRDGNNLAYVNEVAKINIRNSIEKILDKSMVIKELINQKAIKIIGGMYDVSSGKVMFFED